MCGISGFCDFSLNYYDKKPFWETILVQMHETLKHRGPDQAMIDLQPHVGLSHARLSIRDLEGGIQPMTRTFHGKTCSIVYNGEIYNHRELLPELQAAGYRFTTTSDTEIILCAYMHFGKNFVEKLNGIFAFAIWDDTNRELLLYRDRAGSRPLQKIDASDKCGLPCSGKADDSENLALIDRQGNIPHSVDLLLPFSEIFGDVCQFNQIDSSF